MEILSQVAEGMQAVLTKASDIIGGETGFVKRLRKLSGSGFVQTLVFGWLSNPDSTLEELCQSAATLGIYISPQGLNKRFTPQAADCLQKVLETAVSPPAVKTALAVGMLAFPIQAFATGSYASTTGIALILSEPPIA